MPRDLFADILRRLNHSSDEELVHRNRATRSENGRQVEEEPQIIAVGYFIGDRPGQRFCDLDLGYERVRDGNIETDPR